MDALLFAGEWQEKVSDVSDEGKFPLVDEIQDIAALIAPDWPQHSLTKTSWMGASSRFVTPYQHPVCCHGKGKHPVFVVGKEIEGYEGIFELSYCPGIKPRLSSRPSPTPKDPSRKLFSLEGFEADAGTKKIPSKPASTGGDK